MYVLFYVLEMFKSEFSFKVVDMKNFVVDRVNV